MLSMFVLVGKVIEMPCYNPNAKGAMCGHVVIETEHPFQNDDGSVTKDRFKVFFWRGIAEECCDHLKPGDWIAVKGRMQSDVRMQGENKFYNLMLVAEKVSYLQIR